MKAARDALNTLPADIHEVDALKGADANQTTRYYKARHHLEEALANYEKRSPLPVRVKVGDKTVDLKPYTTTIFASTPEWQYIPAGAFTISKLRSEKYVLGKRTVTTNDANGPPVSTEEQFVRRDDAADNQFNLGLAAMIHLSRSTWNPGWLSWMGGARPALTFGIGYGGSQSNSLNYFMGPSLMWGQGVLTVGYNIGDVDVLPRGLKEGDVVPTGESISPMERHTKGAFFFSVSYAFLANGAQSAFESKFADAQGNATPKSADKAADAGSGSGDDSGQKDDDKGGKDTKP